MHRYPSAIALTLAPLIAAPAAAYETVVYQLPEGARPHGACGPTAGAACGYPNGTPAG